MRGVLKLYKYGGFILESSNATTWVKRLTSDTNLWFSSTTYGNSRFVAVGGDNQNEQGGSSILASSDGTTWKTLYTIQIPPQTNYNSIDEIWDATSIHTFNSMIYANNLAGQSGLFVAVGTDGTIVTANADNSGAVIQLKPKQSIYGLKINLTHNRISTTLPFTVSRSQLKVELFSVSGKRIYSATNSAHNGILTIPSIGFPTGKYVMSIRDENNKTLSSSFVLTR
jgi:hypothetical protein